MKRITVQAELSRLDEVLAFIDGVLAEADCPPKVSMGIAVAAEEIFVNIAHYAFPDGEGEATIQVSFEGDKEAVRLDFIDGGLPYNPLSREDPDLTLSAEARRIGGLGVFMVKKMMDEVSYEYKDGKNIFSFKKTLRKC